MWYHANVLHHHVKQTLHTHYNYPNCDTQYIKVHSITIDKQQEIDLKLHTLAFKVGKSIVKMFFPIEI